MPSVRVGLLTRTTNRFPNTTVERNAYIALRSVGMGHRLPYYRQRSRHVTDGDWQVLPTRGESTDGRFECYDDVIWACTSWSSAISTLRFQSQFIFSSAELRVVCRRNFSFHRPLNWTRIWSTEQRSRLSKVNRHLVCSCDTSSQINLKFYPDCVKFPNHLAGL